MSLATFIKMPKVHTLSPDIVSKIAAGEVIERPASVVKELLENALDAGSKSIELHLKQAGRSLIHIKDTGSGIAEDDIENIFQRHATSKITSLDDLFNIHSLGFRGEALYSIAAIADVTLRSKTVGQDMGWEIHLRGGERLNRKPIVMNAGTELEIKELFFNTPARRKFLKSDTAEMNQILSTFTPYCLLYPQLRFLLTHQGRKLVDLQPTKNHKQRVAEALNLEPSHLLEAKREITEEKIALHMILGDINVARSRRDLQFIFINNRPVQNKSIGYHMNEIFRLIMPQGQYPFFAVFIQYPGDEIDVNIHPTKREVKIQNEKLVASLLRRLCEETLMTTGSMKSAETPMEQTTGESILHKAIFETAKREKFLNERIPSEMFEETEQKNPFKPTEQHSFPNADYASAFEENLFQQKQQNLKGKLQQAQFIGTLIDKFLLFESGKSLLVVDQHAAQERITFELLIKQMENSRVEVQHLLAPYLIKLTLTDMLIWEEAKDQFEELGFSTTQFNENTIAIHTYPVLIKDPAKAFKDIIAGEHPARSDHESLARRACRASIMAGDSLGKEQAEFMREQLLKTRDPYTCPHGRPTIIEMSEAFLDKQFLRT